MDEREDYNSSDYVGCEWIYLKIKKDIWRRKKYELGEKMENNKWSEESFDDNDSNYGDCEEIMIMKRKRKRKKEWGGRKEIFKENRMEK